VLTQDVDAEITFKPQCEKRHQPGYEYEDGEKTTPAEWFGNRRGLTRHPLLLCLLESLTLTQRERGRTGLFPALL
jgi:hypothetical protein